MSWADIKRRYETSGGSASQSTEDMVARRILRALGISEAKAWEVERKLGLDKTRNDDTTWLERAVALAQIASKAFYPPPPVMDVGKFSEAEDALLEFNAANTLRDSANPAAVAYRIRGADSVRALVCIGGSDITMLRHDTIPVPCMLRNSRNGEFVLADCDAQVYFDHVINREEINGRLH